MATVTWTGERALPRDFLYQRYLDRAEVRDDAGTVIGEVLHLENGYYQPRVPGLMDEDCATVDQATRAVESMHRRFRS